MNIGIDARMYGPKQTGIGNYTKYLIEYLAKVDQKNHYSIFLRKEEFSRFQILNPRFQEVLADHPWYSLAEQTLFLQKLLRHPLDLTHFPHFNVPLFYHRPFTVTIHDLTPKFFPGEKVGKSWIRRKAYDAILHHAITRSRAIITPSRFTKSDLLKHFAINPKKVYVIPEGIPLPHTVYGSARIQSPSRFTLHASPYILYVGVWRSHKNLSGLVRAFALLKQEGLPHSLVIVGDPDIYYEGLAKLWKELGLEKDVLAPGFQDEEALIDWYQNTSLLILPSFYEGFGLTPLIALRLGVNVAVSNIGALRETLGDGAFYFNPQSPEDMARVIKKALSNTKAREEKLTKAKILLKRYNWETMARDTLEIFEHS